MQTLRGKKINLKHTSYPDDISELLLSLRGFDREKFETELLHDPFLMPDISLAAHRIILASERGERVMIFGDYDVDGISSTAALFLFLRDEMGIDVSYRLPHRVDDGYGIKEYHMEQIAKTGAKLVITVDCGTKDILPIRRAYELGMEVIVTDHHSCPETLPECVAVVNPRRTDLLYPFAGLSGSGVVWKLIHAILLTKKLSQEHIFSLLRKYIDIVCLGTIADCMPMIDENRTIVRWGLVQARQSHHPFFQVFEESLDRPILTEEDVGFFIGPMLNASGRITTPYQGISALLGTKLDAFAKVQGLISVNETRKGLSRDAYERALQSVHAHDSFVVYLDEKLEHGILGIVSAKLTEHFSRPSGVFTRDGEFVVGSLRAPEGIDLVTILNDCADIFERFGGHAGAAGCTIRYDRFDEAVRRISEATIAHYDLSQYSSAWMIDTVLEWSKVDTQLLKDINSLRPFGPQFSTPVFLIENVSASVLSLGQTGEHLRWDISGPTEIIGFRMGEFRDALLSKPHHLIGQLKARTWRDKTTIQFHVLDALLVEESSI